MAGHGQAEESGRLEHGRPVDPMGYAPSRVPGHTDLRMDMLPAPDRFRAVATSLQVDQVRRGGICWTDVAVGFILGVTLGIVAVTAFVELVSGGGR